MRIAVALNTTFGFRRVIEMICLAAALTLPATFARAQTPTTAGDVFNSNSERGYLSWWLRMGELHPLCNGPAQEGHDLTLQIYAAANGRNVDQMNALAAQREGVKTELFGCIASNYARKPLNGTTDGWLKGGVQVNEAAGDVFDSDSKGDGTGNPASKPTPIPNPDSQEKNVTRQGRPLDWLAKAADWVVRNIIGGERRVQEAQAFTDEMRKVAEQALQGASKVSDALAPKTPLDYMLYATGPFGVTRSAAGAAGKAVAGGAAKTALAKTVEKVEVPGSSTASRTPTAARIINSSTRDRYVVQDSTNPRFQVFATVEEGEIFANIRTELETGERSTLLRGSEQFRRILEHFAGRFTRIRGSWSFGDNLKAFNEATARGLLTEAAALETKTGTWAKAAGYTRVIERGLEGSPGAYTKVAVTFTRP